MTTHALPQCTPAQFPIKSNCLFSSLGFGELGFDIFIGCSFDSCHFKKKNITWFDLNSSKRRADPAGLKISLLGPGNFSGAKCQTSRCTFWTTPKPLHVASLDPRNSSSFRCWPGFPYQNISGGTGPCTKGKNTPRLIGPSPGSLIKDTMIGQTTSFHNLSSAVDSWDCSEVLDLYTFFWENAVVNLESNHLNQAIWVNWQIAKLGAK